MQNDPLPTAERVGRFVGAIAVFAIYEFVLIPYLFKSQGEAFNVVQFLCAGIAGVVGGWIGGFLGRTFSNH